MNTLAKGLARITFGWDSSNYMKEEEKRYSKWEYDEEIEDQDDEQSDQEDDQDSDDDQAGNDNPPEKKTFKLDDGTEVDEDELKKGYMRQSDYTRKTQELSAADKAKGVDNAKEVIANKDEYPEEDVKAARYFLKIALNDPKIKEEFGLMTKSEFEEQKQAESNKAQLDSQFSKVGELSKDLGVKAPSEQEIIAYMKDNQIYNAVSAFKEMKENEIFEAKLEKAKNGNKKYGSEKDGKKIGNSGKDKKKMSMDEFLDEELNDMEQE